MAAGNGLSKANFTDRDVELLWKCSDAEESSAGTKHASPGTITTLDEVLLFLTFSGGGDSSS
jgi:hypothetical protein